MSYKYHIHVTHLRSAIIRVSTSDMDQASALSDMDLNEITETLTELNAVIAGQLDYLDWGTDLFYVSSEATVSRYGNYDKVERIQVPTTGLKNFLIELKNLKQQCKAGGYYKTIVGQAFTEIKANRSQYEKWSNYYYYITVNNIEVSLVLLGDDFNLSEGQYVAQLKNDFQ